MGLHIHLTVQLHTLDADAWEAAYEESLLLLRRFPAPLLRFEVCEVGGYHRYRLTDEILCDPGTEQERWEISGDRISGRRAESFRLHRYLHRQISRNPNASETDVDVLWVDEQDAAYPIGAGVDIFGNKTQGYPYHLALLAVGILLENRFPKHCFVHGQLEREPTEQTLSWMNAVLGTDFQLPVCLDGHALYARLAGFYQNQECLIERFQSLFLGDQQEALRTLIACAEPDALQRHIVAELGHYHSLSQRGVGRLLSAYLEVTQDIDGLIDLVMATPSFRTELVASLEALLKTLCRRFVTIAPAERGPLSALDRPAGQLTTIDDAFDGVFRTLMGAPSEVRFYLPGVELLERFAAREPELRERFREIIQAEEAACRKALAEIAAVMSEVVESDEPSGREEHAAPYVDELLSGERYLIHQIEQQQEEVDPTESEVMAEVLGVAVGQMLVTHPQTFSATEPEYYKKLIDWAGQTNGIVLWREAWEEIDHLSDISVLRVLAVLMLITEREASFCQFRTHTLEDKRLWPYLMKRATES
ncbi:hypothetical protein VRRI112168_15590 [Vreelandella rituensis]|uniref:Uncharacterized protein n=1 Tax=Vreelandella rituensis TaxID=2282306 RepID=A0A368U545_9GAMM|nr:hypothetical protein [Halomonas rituensis]RCV92269.1 hypothetical protein DU506_08345 [Halomonas rituensis]